MNHNHIRELLSAYALDTLEPRERRLVVRHLRTCKDCRAAVRENQETIGVLAEAVVQTSPLDPPPGLKGRTIDFVLNNRRSSRIVFSPAIIWAGLVTVALVVAVVWGLRLNATLQYERAEINRLLVQLGRQEIVLEVVDSPQTDRKLLLSPDESSRAYGKIFSAQLPYVVVMVARLPQPPANQQYRLWYTEQGIIHYAGAIPVNDDGFGILVLETDAPPPRFEEVRLTLQPRDASTPSDKIVLSWPVSRR